MKDSKRHGLESADFKVGSAVEFLKPSDEETRMIELRITLARAIRRIRNEQSVTQTELASRLDSSHSLIAKIESGSPDVSLDLMFRALFALGGDLSSLNP